LKRIALAEGAKRAFPLLDVSLPRPLDARPGLAGVSID
jgi:hypothetical protein